MSTTTENKQVILNANGDPVIRGTTMKVIEIVQAQKAYGWSLAEIHLNHRYLSMEQVHAALAYYWANKETLDADMQRRLEYTEKMRQQQGKTIIERKLRETSEFHALSRA